MKKNIWRILTLIWCVFIFVQSHMNGIQSGNESKWFFMFINRLISQVFNSKAEFITEFLIRKTAHFVEYMILGIFLMNAVKTYERIPKKVPVAVIIGAFYAVTDEFHQYFIPGRAMSVYDMLIDSAGVLTGVIATELVCRKRLLIQKSELEKEEEKIYN